MKVWRNIKIVVFLVLLSTLGFVAVGYVDSTHAIWAAIVIFVCFLILIPKTSPLGKIYSELIAHILTIFLVLLIVTLDAESITVDRVCIGLSILGLIFGRLDVLIGADKFYVLETLFTKYFDIKVQHRAAVNFAKFPVGYKKLVFFAEMEGKTVLELMEEINERPTPNILSIAFVYIVMFPLWIKNIVSGLVYVTQKVLKIMGGNSVIKFFGFLFLLVAGLIKIYYV